jgi:uncharacterized membrane protein (UPF0127 family)
VRPTPKVPARPDPPPGPAPGCPPDPTGRLSLPWGKVVFPAAGVAVKVEVARSFDERARGLMYRTELPEDQGMLFIFGNRANQSFWMKNTYLPLSIAFIDASGTIISIQDMEPLDDETMHRSPKPALWALEMNQGWFVENGISVGDTVSPVK